MKGTIFSVTDSAEGCVYVKLCSHISDQCSVPSMAPKYTGWCYFSEHSTSVDFPDFWLLLS